MTRARTLAACLKSVESSNPLFAVAIAETGEIVETFRPHVTREQAERVVEYASHIARRI